MFQRFFKTYFSSLFPPTRHIRGLPPSTVFSLSCFSLYLIFPVSFLLFIPPPLLYASAFPSLASSIGPFVLSCRGFVPSGLPCRCPVSGSFCFLHWPAVLLLVGPLHCSPSVCSPLMPLLQLPCCPAGPSPFFFCLASCLVLPPESLLRPCLRSC